MAHVKHFIIFLISGTAGPQCIPGALRSLKHQDHPGQRQSHSADNEQTRQLWKWWAHSWDDATSVFVHLNCQSTSDSECLCTRASCNRVCVHNMFISLRLLILYRTRRACSSYICSALLKINIISLSILASTYSIMAGREPLTVFSSMPWMFFMCRSDLGINTVMRRLLSEPD